MAAKRFEQLGPVRFDCAQVLKTRPEIDRFIWHSAVLQFTGVGLTIFHYIPSRVDLKGPWCQRAHLGRFYCVAEHVA